jgi:hypothetical protein
VQRRTSVVTLIAVVAAAFMPAAALAAPQKPHPVHVPAAADPWTSSGITLTAGDPLEIVAHGMAITGPLAQFPGAKSGPDGQPTLCPDPGGPSVGCALDGAPYGALIGRIGGVVFLVGAGYAGTSPAGGTLEFAVNDNLGYHWDNLAGFTVFVNR